MLIDIRNSSAFMIHSNLGYMFEAVQSVCLSHKVFCAKKIVQSSV